MTRQIFSLRPNTAEFLHAVQQTIHYALYIIYTKKSRDVKSGNNGGEEIGGRPSDPQIAETRVDCVTKILPKRGGSC